ncbi:MAG: hypothetical protein ACLQBD_31155 [Syntrophobacteraceae bacterium]
MELKRQEFAKEAEAKAEQKDQAASLAKEDVSGLNVREEPKEPPLGDGEATPGNESTVLGWKRTRFKKVIMFGSPALCLLLAVAGFLFIKFKTHTPRLEPVTSIMRPIPLPDYREMVDFLLVYEIEGQRMITAIRMEVGYQSPTRYQNFKEQKVAFRDVIYNFLLKQNLSGNSVKSWHSVLEKDLLDCLMAKLPQSCADTIVLTQVENL